MNRRQREIAEQFDREGASGVVARTSEEQAYIEGLERLRAGVRSVAMKAEIGDAQMPAFMRGIREGIEKPPRLWGRTWALLSLSTAALLVAYSAFLVLTWHKDTGASVVEAVSTQITGATVKSYSQDDGTQIFWVNKSIRDLP